MEQKFDNSSVENSKPRWRRVINLILLDYDYEITILWNNYLHRIEWISRVLIKNYQSYECDDKVCSIL